MLKNILSHFTRTAAEKPEINPGTASYRYEINADQCRSCDRCRKACKAGAISGERGKVYVINDEKCLKCGNCVKWCKYKAIKRLDSEP